MSEHIDTPFDAFAEAEAMPDQHWAFGTTFTDPLAGVDAAVPVGLDPRELALDCVALGDDALVLAQRVAGWCSRAPELEDEMALANIALDLIGQARLLYARAVRADPRVRPAGAAAHIPDEDALAYFRDEPRWLNVRLAEIDDGGDFAICVARLFLLSAWRLALLSTQRESADPVLSAVAVRAVTELSYHREYSAGWLVRLGDGTEYSRRRMADGLAVVWPFVAELHGELTVRSRSEFDAAVTQVLAAASLDRPGVAPRAGVNGRLGRDGVHTEMMGYVLAELQTTARSHPEGVW